MGCPKQRRILSSGFFPALELLPLPPAKQSHSRVGDSCCQDPFVAPRGCQHRSHLPAMFRPFPPGNLPHSHLQSPSPLLTNNSCASEGARGTGLELAILCLAADPLSVHSSHGPRRPPQGTRGGDLLVCSNHLPNLEGSSDGHRDVPTLMHASNFHRATPCVGIPLIGHVSTALLLTRSPGYWPLPISR